MKKPWKSSNPYYPDMPEPCHGGRDDECYSIDRCPQLRDGEPEKSGRHCPLDIAYEAWARETGNDR